MAPILKDYPRASFDAIEFPFTDRTARLEARTHVHEYPKMAGGSVEKLGRKLWSFTFRVPFHTTFSNFPDLYPGRLDALTERCARLDTAPLLVPEIGTIRCLLTKIERTRQGRIHSGEECSLEFLEDDLEPFRRTTVPEAKASVDAASESVASFATVYFDAAPDIPAVIEQKKRVDNILSLTDFLSSIKDQTTLFGLQARGKVASLLGLIRAVHELLKGPDTDPLRAALRDLWLAAQRLQQDLAGKDEVQNVIRPWVVPQTMSVGQIAQRLYADASRGGEVLSLNGRISDPYAVPAGTRLLVYAA